MIRRQRNEAPKPPPTPNATRMVGTGTQVIALGPKTRRMVRAGQKRHLKKV